MKKIIIAIVLLPFMNQAQTDTIFKKSGDKIICKITFVNENNIFYETRRSAGNIDVKEIKFYSQSGNRSTIQEKQNVVITEKLSSSTLAPIKQTDDLANIKMCLKRCHDQYKLGVITGLSGLGLTIVGTSVAVSTKDLTYTPLVFGCGGILMLVGGVIAIDSHKWIGRAALSLNPNSISLTYKIK